MCGHSLEVNVTSSLDFYLSVAQVHLLQQLLNDNFVGTDSPEKSAEVQCMMSSTEKQKRITPRPSNHMNHPAVINLHELPQLDVHQFTSGYTGPYHFGSRSTMT